MVIGPHQLHEHQHVNGSVMAYRLPPKMDATRVAVEPAQPQADINLVPVRRDALDTDAGAGKRGGHISAAKFGGVNYPTSIKCDGVRISGYSEQLNRAKKPKWR